MDQFHSNHMWIEKMQPLPRESVYYINMNANIECTVKQYTMCLEYQQTQPKEKALHFEIPCRQWEVVGAHIFMIYGKTLLCIVDYYSKFPIVKKVNSLSADNLVQMAKLIFAEYGFQRKLFHMRV